MKAQTTAFDLGPADAADGHHAEWHPQESPHMVVTGPDGAGKTNLARLVAAQASAAGWQVVDLDDTGLRGPLNSLRRLTDALMDRYTAMSAAGVSHYAALNAPFVPVLVVADRADLLVAWSPAAAMHLSMLARLGRAAGILLVITVTSGARLPEALDSDLTARVVLTGKAGPALLEQMGRTEHFRADRAE